MGISLFDAMKKVASDFIVSSTSRKLRNHDLPEHHDEEFLGSLGFTEPKRGSGIPVQDARQGIQDVLKGNIALTSNQHEDARFAIYQGEAWGVSTEIDFISSTIKYRWAFKPDFDSSHYEVLIFRTEGSDFPDDYPFQHGHATPFVQSHLREGEQNLDSKPGSSYAHTAVLRDRRTGKGADPLRFVTKVYTMEDWESLNSAASRLKNDPPKRERTSVDPMEREREKQKKKTNSEKLLKTELELIDLKEEGGSLTPSQAENERERARIEHHKRLRDAKVI